MEVKISSFSYLLEKKKRGLLYNTVKLISDSISLNKNQAESSLLLNKVSMQLLPGSITALMGLGHNYKYLLECISLRQIEGMIGGKIHYDGSARKPGIYKDIVLINDIGITHFESLTVFDYLYYGARLRVTHGVIECRERARLAGRLVGLDGNTKIGRLSKSEVRILSIAVELVGNPTLICLIDPTEGLDAGGALDVMRVLHAVSKRASMTTTIVYNVFSIHEDMFRLVDNIALFVESKLEYYCPVRNYSSRALLTAYHLVTQASAVVLDHERNHSYVKHKGDLSAVSESHANSLLRIIGELDRLTEQEGGEGKPRSSSMSATARSSVTSGSTDNSSVRNAAHFTGHVDSVESISAAGGSVDLYRSTLHSGRAEEHYTRARRLAEPGLPIRYQKSLRQQFTILFLRSMAYHWKNVSFANIIDIFRFIVLLCKSEHVLAHGFIPLHACGHYHRRPGV
jgi:ABC-type multidrug transport system ATPase subunit